MTCISQKLLSILTTLFLLLVLVGGVGAAGTVEITVDVPTTPVGFQQVIAIPVTLHNAENIVSFAAQVSNMIDGATITINEDVPISGMYAVNSDPEHNTQKIAWASGTGVTADSVTLFVIDVLITDETLSSVPVSVSITELGTLDGKLPIGSYTVTSPGILTTTNGNGSNSEVSPSATPSDTVSPNPTASSSDPTQSPVTEQQTSVGTEPVPTLPVATSTTVATPGFSIVLLVVSLGIVVFIGGKRKL